MSEDKFKICPYCAEQVKAAAKVCPRCRQWLCIFSLRNPATLISATALCFFLLMTYLILGVHRAFDLGMDFSPYRNQISVVESRMDLGTILRNNINEPCVYVVAVITNQTDKAWRGVDVEARFFDKAGKLIDVGQGQYYDTLYPQTDGALRIKAGMLRPVTDYDSYKLYIGSAADPHSRF
jgi:hypothetical protein